MVLFKPVNLIFGLFGNKVTSTKATEHKSSLRPRSPTSYGASTLGHKQSKVHQALPTATKYNLSKKHAYPKVTYDTIHVPTFSRPKRTATDALKAILARSNASSKPKVPEVVEEVVEVDIAGTVITSWSTEETPVEAYETEEVVDDGAEISLPSHEPLKSNATALDLYRPSTYLQHPTPVPSVLQPVSIPVSQTNTCTAVVMYIPPITVCDSELQYAQILDRLLAPCVFDGETSRVITMPTTTQHDILPCPPEPTSSTALVVYRPPVHLDMVFAYSQAWNQLLATATCAAEHLWQAVLSKACVEVFNRCFELDELARVGIVDEHEIISSETESNSIEGGMKLGFSPVFTIAESACDADITADASVVSQADESSPPVFVDNASDSPNPSTKSTQSEECLDIAQDFRILSPEPIEHPDSGLESAAEHYASADDVEKKQLEDDLRRQQTISAQLRTQLVDREEQYDEVVNQLKEAKHRCDLYADESDSMSVRLNQLEQELAVTKGRLSAKERQAARVAQPSAPASNPAGGLNVPVIMAAYTRVTKELEQAEKEKLFLGQMLNAVIKERDDFQQEAQTAQDDVKRVEHLRDIVEQLKKEGCDFFQQKETAVKQKEVADERILLVEQYNKNLLSEYAVQHATNPPDYYVPNICVPNELVSAQKALEITQQTLAEVIETNLELDKDLKTKTNQVDLFRQDNELLESKVAMYSSSFEMCKRKIVNFVISSGILRQLEAGVEVDGLEQALNECAQLQIEHVKALKKFSGEAADAKAKLKACKGKHRSEVKQLTAQKGQLEVENQELYSENLKLEMESTSLEFTLQALEEAVAEKDKLVEQWRAQAEEQAFGDQHEVVVNNYESRLAMAQDQIEALQSKLYEVATALDQALENEGWCRTFYARQLSSVRELGYMCDWYRKQVRALRERFAGELLVKPLDIPYEPDWKDLSEEQKEMLNKHDNDAILRLTGYDMELALAKEPVPRDLTMDMIWSEVAEAADILEATHLKIFLRKQGNLGAPTQASTN